MAWNRNGRQLDARTRGDRDLAVLEDPDLSGADIGRAQEQLDDALPAQPVEIDGLLQHVAQRIVVERVELIGRHHPRHHVEEQEHRGILDRMILHQAIEPARLQRAPCRRLADPAPEFGERASCALATARGQAIGHHRGVHGAGTGGADPFERYPLVFEQTIHRAPGEGAVRSAALQGKIDCLAGVTHPKTPCRPVTVFPKARDHGRTAAWKPSLWQQRWVARNAPMLADSPTIGTDARLCAHRFTT